jgi:hypothetical protein
VTMMICQNRHSTWWVILKKLLKKPKLCNWAKLAIGLN